MNVIGAVMLLAGLAGAGVAYYDAPVEPFHSLPFGFAHWLGIASLGGLLVYFNRRPGN